VNVIIQSKIKNIVNAETARINSRFEVPNSNVNRNPKPTTRKNSPPINAVLACQIETHMRELKILTQSEGL